MNSRLRLALAVALGAAMPLLSADCIGSSDPAIPGGDNSGFTFPDDGAGGSPGEGGTTEASGSLGMDGGPGSDATADAPTDAPNETAADAMIDAGVD